MAGPRRRDRLPAGLRGSFAVDRSREAGSLPLRGPAAVDLFTRPRRPPVDPCAGARRDTRRVARSRPRGAPPICRSTRDRRRQRRDRPLPEVPPLSVPRPHLRHRAAPPPRRPTAGRPAQAGARPSRHPRRRPRAISRLLPPDIPLADRRLFHAPLGPALRPRRRVPLSRHRGRHAEAGDSAHRAGPARWVARRCSLARRRVWHWPPAPAARRVASTPPALRDRHEPGVRGGGGGGCSPRYPRWLSWRRTPSRCRTGTGTSTP